MRTSFARRRRMSSPRWRQRATPAAPEPAPPTAEPAPWDEPAVTGGETRAFPRMSLEEMRAMAVTSAPAQEESPWSEPSEPAFAEPLAHEEAPFEPEMTAAPA